MLATSRTRQLRQLEVAISIAITVQAQQSVQRSQKSCSRPGVVVIVSSSRGRCIMEVFTCTVLALFTAEWISMHPTHSEGLYTVPSAVIALKYASMHSQGTCQIVVPILSEAVHWEKLLAEDLSLLSRPIMPLRT